MNFFTVETRLWLLPVFFWLLALCSSAQAASSQYDDGLDLVAEEFYQIVVSADSLRFLGLSEEDLEVILGDEMLSHSRKLEEVLALLQEAYEVFDGELLVQACSGGDGQSAPERRCTTIRIEGGIKVPGFKSEAGGRIEIEKCTTTCGPVKQPSSNGSKGSGSNGSKKGGSPSEDRIIIFYPRYEI